MRKFILAASTAAVAFAGVTTASAQDKVTLRFLTAWDDRFVGT
jgi:ABC-type glycerol-3-phosphate transport system substrate-binding protein